MCAWWKKKKNVASQIALRRFVISHFGHRPKNIAYFECAVTHPSFLTNDAFRSYERLEFLGDTVIDTIIAEFLFHRFPHENEGFLTQVKSRLVSRRVHLEISTKMNMVKVLRYQSGRNINPGTLSGNAFEAMIGAIFLDAGFDQARKCLLQHVFRKYVDINQLLNVEHDFKSKLIIWCQKRKIPLRFKVTNSEQKDSSQWVFSVETLLNGQRFGIGTGANKKSAEQMAAKQTFDMIEGMNEDLFKEKASKEEQPPMTPKKP